MPADLRTDWPAALAAAGFRPTEQTAWLAEGLLVYLSSDETTRMLTAVGDLSASGSRIAFEHGTGGSGSLLAQARAIPALDQFTALRRGGLGEQAPD